MTAFPVVSHPCHRSSTICYKHLKIKTDILHSACEEEATPYWEDFLRIFDSMFKAPILELELSSHVWISQQLFYCSQEPLHGFTNLHALGGSVAQWQWQWHCHCESSPGLFDDCRGRWNDGHETDGHENAGHVQTPETCPAFSCPSVSCPSFQRPPTVIK